MVAKNYNIVHLYNPIIAIITFSKSYNIAIILDNIFTILEVFVPSVERIFHAGVDVKLVR